MVSDASWASPSGVLTSHYLAEVRYLTRLGKACLPGTILILLTSLSPVTEIHSAYSFCPSNMPGCMIRSEHVSGSRFLIFTNCSEWLVWSNRMNESSVKEYHKNYLGLISFISLMSLWGFGGELAISSGGICTAIGADVTQTKPDFVCSPTIYTMSELGLDGSGFLEVDDILCSTLNFSLK